MAFEYSSIVRLVMQIYRDKFYWMLFKSFSVFFLGVHLLGEFEGNLYLERTMSAKVCCKCHEAVSRRAINALGKIYHPHHFTCKECDKPIVDAVFNVQKGEPVCQSCYQEKYASRCHCCGTLIMERAIVAAKRKWHEKCFRCVRCRKSLIKSNFFEVNGYLFCKHDYRKLFSSRCASCEQPIGGNATIALNTKWHAECFRCLCCQQPIGGDFAIYNGDPVCANCVNRFSVY